MRLVIGDYCDGLRVCDSVSLPPPDRSASAVVLRLSDDNYGEDKLRRYRIILRVDICCILFEFVLVFLKAANH